MDTVRRIQQLFFTISVHEEISFVQKFLLACIVPILVRVLVLNRRSGTSSILSWCSCLAHEKQQQLLQQ